jgi:hypothetical protein
MLNKEICKHCYSVHYAEFGLWDDYDEALWKEEKVVMCPHRGQDKGRSIYKLSPKCEFYLEQMMENQC